MYAVGLDTIARQMLLKGKRRGKRIHAYKKHMHMYIHIHNHIYIYKCKEIYIYTYTSMSLRFCGHPTPLDIAQAWNA